MTTMRKINSTMAALVAAAMLAAKAMAQQQDEELTAPKRRIVISIADRKLALTEDGEVIRIYDIAVGAPKTPSPVGVFTIVNRIPNPTWWGPKEVVAPGKANPLGTRWMGLSQKGYGIHGTNNQRSIGRNVSHGCIRMRKADVEELFELVPVGVVVELVSERTEEIAMIFGGVDAAALAE
ncbi:MAG: L,D-transpeptidase [Bryobacteraceae bacterium]